MSGRAAAKYGPHGGVVALALLALGATVLRRGSGDCDRRDGSPAPVSRVAAAPEAPAPDPRGDEPPALAASRAVREEAALSTELARLTVRGGEVSSEDLQHLRQIEGRRDQVLEVLREQLEVSPSSWPDVLEALARLPAGDSARRILEKLRNALGPSGASSVASLLRPDCAPGVKRLAIAALVFQDDDEVLSALAREAQEDPDSAIRQEAFRSLAERRSRFLARGLSSSLIDETLRRGSAADPDPETRACARGLAECPPIAGTSGVRPPPRQSRGWSMGRGM